VLGSIGLEHGMAATGDDVIAAEIDSGYSLSVRKYRDEIITAL
jgi:hypothetical protein